MKVETINLTELKRRLENGEQVTIPKHGNKDLHILRQYFEPFGIFIQCIESKRNYLIIKKGEV